MVSLEQQRISQIKFEDIRHVLYEPEDLRLTLSIAFVNAHVVIQGWTCAPADSLAQLASTLMGAVLGEQATQDLECLNPQRQSHVSVSQDEWYETCSPLGIRGAVVIWCSYVG